MSLRPRDESAPALPGFGPSQAFRAASMRDAFAAVKAAIGPEAVILSTRELGREDETGARFEVVAAWPSSLATGTLAQAMAAPTEVRRRREPSLPDVETRISRPGFLQGEVARSQHEVARAQHEIARPQHEVARTPRAADEVQLTHQLRQLEEAVRSLQSQIQLLGERDKRMREEVARLSQAKAILEEGGPTAKLMAAGLERDVASEIAERAVRRATPKQGLAVAKDPDLAGEILRTLRVATALWNLPSGSVAAFIGPSGGGKTTSLLKVAGLATFAHRRRVAIVSTDVDRLGAFESLALYAEVMGVPCLAARDRGAVDQALDTFHDKDLVLIDTPGHNPFDDEQRFKTLKPVAGREVRHHLVLPATLSPSLVADMLQIYESPACESLIVTRLDEARGPSAVLAACLRAEVPVSHLATGREIPDDIRVPDPHELAQSLMRDGGALVERAS